MKVSEKEIKNITNKKKSVTTVKKVEEILLDDSLIKENPYKKIQAKGSGPYTEIFLIRHCRQDYSQQELVADALVPLSRAGLKERSFLTNRLLKMKIDTVYASTLKRAQDSASEFLKISKKRLKIDAGLDEVDWQQWRNIKYFNMSEEGRKKRFTGHEVMDKQLDRIQAEARRVLAKIYKNNKGKRVAVFCHGNLIRSLITGIVNADVIGFLSIEVFHSSISEIVIDKNGYLKIIYINDVNHLPTPPARKFFEETGV